MKAARLHAYGRGLVLDEVPTPTPGPGEVVVRIEGAGFCHSDIHVIDGEIQVLPRMPLTLGHENAGRDPGLADHIRALTSGRGVSASFDFVGSDSTLALAVGATRAMGKVTQVGLAGGTATLKVLQNAQFEVTFETTLWGTIKELREVLALAESGRLSPIPLTFRPLEQINEVYAEVKRGQIDGRAVITPSATVPR